MATNKGNNSNISYATTGNVDWSVFLQEGVIVTLTIKRYRGMTTVDFSELGLGDEEGSQLSSFLAEYIQPGQKRLIPPEIEGQLNSIETTARTNLKDCSFDCSMFASTGRFVPQSMYSQFKQVNEELSERFYEIRDEFAKNYSKIVGQVRKDYKVLAERLYMQSHPDASKPSASYVNSFVDKIVAQIPPVEEIVESFEYSTFLSKIPDYLLNAIRGKNNIDEKVMRIAASNTSVPQKQKKKKTELEKDVEASIKAQSKGIVNEFVGGVVDTLKAKALDGAHAIITSIDKNDGKLVGRASVRAYSLVTEMRNMNFYEDAVLEDLVSQLEDALGETSDDRDIEEVKVAVAAIADWAHRKTPKNSTKTSQTTSNRQTKKTNSSGQKLKISVKKTAQSRRTVKQVG